MNQPSQPTPARSAGETHPLPVDNDPYYSIAMNVPSGPVSSSGYRPLPSPSVDFGSAGPANAAQQGHQSFQAGLDILEGLNTEACQLESAAAEESELPMPIRNAFCIDGTEPSSCAEASATCELKKIVAQDEAGRFIASKNSVVCVDGNDGFDYIDLSDRDVAHVTFGDSCMTVVDADTGESFAIEYQNVSRALFANGQMIELT